MAIFKNVIFISTCSYLLNVFTWVAKGRVVMNEITISKTYSQCLMLGIDNKIDFIKCLTLLKKSIH